MITKPAEAPSSIEQVVIPKKYLKEVVLQAQKEIRADINALRLQISSQLDELAEIGGEDVYEEAVLTFVNASGPAGISASKLHAVLPDGAALTQARIALVNAKKINAEKLGMTFKLTPVAA